MKLRGAVALALLAVPAVAVPPAQAASTRAEYIAQVDPICQARTGLLDKKTAALNRNWKRLGRVAKSGSHHAFVNQNKRTAEALLRLEKVHMVTTDLIHDVQAAPEDSVTISSWIEDRRHTEGHLFSGSVAIGLFNYKQAVRQIHQANAAAAAAFRDISGFGFQFCNVGS